MVHLADQLNMLLEFCPPDRHQCSFQELALQLHAQILRRSAVSFHHSCCYVLQHLPDVIPGNVAEIKWFRTIFQSWLKKIEDTFLKKS